MTTPDSIEPVQPTIVVDVAALRTAVAAAKPTSQMIMVTPEQLETLLLVVDENVVLRRDLEMTHARLRQVLETIDATLAPALEAESVPPPPPGDGDGGLE